MNPLPLILGDLRRRWAGAFALALLVAMSIALGVAVSAIERGLRAASADAARPFDLLIGMPGSPTQMVLTGVFLQPAALPLLPGDLLGRLQNEPGIAWAAPIGFGDSWRGLAIVGTTSALVTRGGRLAPSEGRLFQSIDEAVIGARVRLQLGDTIEPSHGIGHEDDDDDADAHAHRGVGYRIVGRMPATGSPWDRAILVPIEAVWDTHAMGTGHAEGDTRIGPPFANDAPGVPLVAVAPDSFAAAYMLRAKYRVGGTMAVFPGEVLASLHTSLGDIGRVLTVFALAAQSLVAGAVLLVVAVAVAAQRRSLAVLRALGAPRGFLFLAVWGEIALLLAIASLLGLAIGWGLVAGFSFWADRAFSLTIAAGIGAREILLVAAAFALGAILAALPAATIYRHSTARALKSTSD